MFEIDFEFYRYVFCVVIGALFGFIFLIFRVMTNTAGLFRSIADRNEYGAASLLITISRAAIAWLALGSSFDVKSTLPTPNLLIRRFLQPENNG